MSTVTPAERRDALERWERDHPPIGAKPRPCDWCGLPCVVGCRDDQYERCQQYTDKLRREKLAAREEAKAARPDDRPRKIQRKGD